MDLESKELAEKIEGLIGPIHDILISDWDPIGVGSFKEAQDEYDSYIPVICRLLLSGADRRQIAEHLHQITTANMGLHGNMAHDTQVAEKLLILISPTPSD